MTHKALEKYFHTIINQPAKETTMFDVLKAKLTEFWNTRYVFDVPPPPPSKAFLDFKAEMDKSRKEFNADIDKATEELTKLVEFVEEDPKLYEDGYWAFEMYTPEWVNEHGEKVEPVHTVLVEPHEGTWLEVLDHILDAMEAHYGYNIKEQVYYSVPMPLNIEGEAGFGRCLNDEVLQKLLLSYPEAYDFKGHIEQ